METQHMEAAVWPSGTNAENALLLGFAPVEECTMRYWHRRLQ